MILFSLSEHLKQIQVLFKGENQRNISNIGLKFHVFSIEESQLYWCLIWACHMALCCSIPGLYAYCLFFPVKHPKGIQTWTPDDGFWYRHIYIYIVCVCVYVWCSKGSTLLREDHPTWPTYILPKWVLGSIDHAWNQLSTVSHTCQLCGVLNNGAEFKVRRKKGFDGFG